MVASSDHKTEHRSKEDGMVAGAMMRVQHRLQKGTPGPPLLALRRDFNNLERKNKRKSNICVIMDMMRLLIITIGSKDKTEQATIITTRNHM